LCRCSTRCRRSRCSRSGVHRRGKRPSTTVSHGVVHVARGAIVIVGIARHRFRGQPVQRIVAIIHSAAAQLRHGQAISRRAQRIRVVRQRARIFRRANLRQPVQRVVAVGVRHPVRIREVLQIAHRAGGPPLRFVQGWDSRMRTLRDFDFDLSIPSPRPLNRVRIFPPASTATPATTIFTFSPAVVVIASPGWQAGAGAICSCNLRGGSRALPVCHEAAARSVAVAAAGLSEFHPCNLRKGGIPAGHPFIANASDFKSLGHPPGRPARSRRAEISSEPASRKQGDRGGVGLLSRAACGAKVFLRPSPGRSALKLVFRSGGARWLRCFRMRRGGGSFLLTRGSGSRGPLRACLGGWPTLSVFSLPAPELWVPRPCAFCKGGYDAACTMWFRDQAA
jgi:hypothetical protein